MVSRPREGCCKFWDSTLPGTRWISSSTSTWSLARGPSVSRGARTWIMAWLTTWNTCRTPKRAQGKASNKLLMLCALGRGASTTLVAHRTKSGQKSDYGLRRPKGTVVYLCCVEGRFTPLCHRVGMSRNCKTMSMAEALTSLPNHTIYKITWKSKQYLPWCGCRAHRAKLLFRECCRISSYIDSQWLLKSRQPSAQSWTERSGLTRVRFRVSLHALDDGLALVQHGATSTAKCATHWNKKFLFHKNWISI